MTYETMEGAVRRNKSARWINKTKVADTPGQFDRSLVVGAPGIEFKSTGFCVQLRPDLPRLVVFGGTS